MKKYLIGSAIVLSLIIGVGAQTVSALTSSEADTLVAILGLTGDKAAAVRALVTPSTTTTTSGTMSGVSFTRNLGIGSRGDDVSALQSWLESKGYLTIPAGTAKGYFGTLTKNAVAAYQASVGIQATGYVGPQTRGQLNASGSTTTTTTTTTGGFVCPPTLTCLPTGTTTGGTTGGTTGSTPGAEGSITVTLSSDPSSGTTVREGQSSAPIIGAKIEAKDSDMVVKRIKLNLGTSSSIYTKVFSKLTVIDENGNALASVPLNSSTVTQDGSNYTVQVSGFNYVVAKGTTKNLRVAADLMGSISSSYTGNKTITIPSNGIRATDGAGIDNYGPSSDISRTVTVSTNIADQATLSLSLGGDTPRSTEVVANQNLNSGLTENDLDKLTLATIKLEAKQDDIKVTNFYVGVTASNATVGTTTTAYLYNGDTLLGSGTITNGVAIITDDFWVRAGDNNGVANLTVKVDIRDVPTTGSTFTASTTASGITAENSTGTSITASGSAIGNAITVRSVAPVFTLTNRTVTKSATASQNNTSTSTLQATFTLHVKAVGGDIMFGTTGSGTPAFGTSSTYFKVYQNGVATTLIAASSTSFTLPSSGVVTSGLTNSFTIQKGNEVDIPVTFLLEGRTTAGANVSTGNYSVGLEGIKWEAGNGTQTSNFMAGLSDWRTSDVVLP